MSAAKILQELPTLSSQELKMIQAALDHLLTRDADAGPVYHALMTVLGMKVSYIKFQRIPAYKAYRAGEAEIIRFIEATWGDTKKVPLHGLLKYLLQLVIDDLRLQGLRPLPHHMAAGMSRIQQIFEHQFPGYKEAGLCGSILTAMSLAK